MSLCSFSFTEIEAAADALPASDKQQLLLFFAARLQEQAGHLPPPRNFPDSQLQKWMAEDEADMQRFRNSQAE